MNILLSIGNIIAIPCIGSIIEVYYLGLLIEQSQIRCIRTTLSDAAVRLIQNSSSRKRSQLCRHGFAKSGDVVKATGGRRIVHVALTSDKQNTATVSSIT